MRIQQALARSIEDLEAGGLASEARFEAEVLLADLLDVDRLRLRTHSETELKPDQVTEFFARIKRRAAREPTAHILGFREFHRYRFIISPDVLVPRPETEQIVELAAGELRPPGQKIRVLDLCTGSGCIGVTLLQEFTGANTECDMVLTDLSRAALAIARKNLVQIVAPEAARRCRLYQGDLDLALPEPERILGFDLIVSNPPYIGIDESAELAPEVRDYEPHMALFHDNVLGLYRRILIAARELLKAKGTLILELGPRFAEEILKIANENFEFAELRKDYAGLDRVLIAKQARASTDADAAE
ncbi:MAG: peptide chain release factor N(5)-glutamine methyltransferase [bacterium]|nr:peptide chain release factor N(5)-glutamine methyltransferase [bacterium]